MLMALNSRASRKPSCFVARRFGRLWPLHVTVLACFVILHGIVGWELGEAAVNPALSLRTIMTNLLFIQIYDEKSWLTWNAPSWSISAEFWTYLVFAMTCLLFSTRRQHVVALLAIAVGAGSVIVFRSTDWLETNTADTVFRCLYGFAFGGLTYHAFRSLPAKSGSLLEIFAVLLVIAYVDRTGNQIMSMIAPGIFGFSIWVFAQERGILSAAMKLQLFVRLGAWSYSIYMVHWLLRNFLLHADETIGRWTADRLISGHLPMIGEPMQLIVVSLYLLATVLLAAVTYRWIEQPGRQFVNRWVERLSRSEQA